MNETKNAQVLLLKAATPQKQRMLLIGVLLSGVFELFLSYCTTTMWPVMAKDLNGMDSYSLGIVLGLVCTAISIPVSGALIRRFSIRTIMVLSNLLALLGCVVAFFAQSITVLLLSFIVVSSFFFGFNYALTPVVFSMMFERKRAAYWIAAMEGALGAACIMTSPIFAGLIMDRWGWRAMMLVLSPLAIVGAVLMLLYMPRTRPVGGQGAKFDLGGLTLMTVGFLSFSYAARMGGTARPWGDPLIIGLLLLTVVCAVGFILVEKRMGERALLPLAIFKVPIMKPLFFSACLARASISIFRGYLPRYMMEAMGRSSTEQGIAMACSAVMGVLLSVALGKKMTRSGKVTGVLMSGCLVLCLTLTYFLVFIRGNSPIWMVWLGMLIFSYSFMMANTFYLVAAQLVLPREQVSQGLVGVKFGHLLGSTSIASVNGALLGLAPTLQQGMSYCYLLDFVITFGLMALLWELYRRLNNTKNS